jgi:ATP-dependent RNA helicase
LVINYELPLNMESYIHRIGRAGRYGRKGTTINLLISGEEAMMTDICTKYGITPSLLPQDIKTLLL